MRSLLISLAALTVPTLAQASNVEDYSTSCRVNGGEASASISSEASFVKLSGQIRLTALDYRERVVDEHTIESNVETRSNEITRLAAVDVDMRATHCRIDTSGARIWVDGLLVQDIPSQASTTVVEHHHVYEPARVVYPRTQVYSEVTYNSYGGSASYRRYREPSRVVVVERNPPRRSRRVETVVVRREPERVIVRQEPVRRVEKVIVRPSRPRSQTQINIDLPVMHVKM